MRLVLNDTQVFVRARRVDKVLIYNIRADVSNTLSTQPYLPSLARGAGYIPGKSYCTSSAQTYQEQKRWLQSTISVFHAARHSRLGAYRTLMPFPGFILAFAPAMPGAPDQPTHVSDAMCKCVRRSSPWALSEIDSHCAALSSPCAMPVDDDAGSRLSPIWGVYCWEIILGQFLHGVDTCL